MDCSLHETAITLELYWLIVFPNQRERNLHVTDTVGWVHTSNCQTDEHKIWTSHTALEKLMSYALVYDNFEFWIHLSKERIINVTPFAKQKKVV